MSTILRRPSMAVKRKRIDNRPICTCGAYDFPHKIGGQCDGSAFAEHYYYWNTQACFSCALNNGSECEVVTGQESINYACCYQQFKHEQPGEYLPID